MKEVYFKNLMIADLQNRTARVQLFEKGLNVVTSTDNHMGKSSLLKSLYYTLGAEVDYDSVWDKQSKLYIATLGVGGKEYRVVRLLKRFAVFEGEKLLKITDNVTKELAPLLGGIFDFSVYLPRKDTGKVEMAPPVFTFMPYYIDQDKGWSGLYNSFAAIEQYKSADRIKSLYYHLNIYTKGTVELMAERDRLKERLETLAIESDRLSTILTALREETDNLPPADTVNELEAHLEGPKKRIEQLVTQIGAIRNEIQGLETALHQHQYNLRVITEHVSIKDIVSEDDTYKRHICPNCGYIFDEEIFNLVRVNYGMMNENYMCQQIQLLIDSVSDKLGLAKERYVSLRQQMQEEEAAFQAEKNEFDIYIRQRGLAASVCRFQKQLDEATVEAREVDQYIKKINKELRKLPNRKDVEEKYIECVRLNIMTLGAWDPAYDGTIRLLKPIKAQGTLENKIILAQFVALFQTMEYFKTGATRFSFVVDSPRAKEASTASSKDILKMIVQMKMLPQIILATIDYSEFESEMGAPANVIVLTEKRKLLNSNDFVENQEYIISMAELLKNHH
ncbi:MAG: hypothetical protein HDT18_11115 [Oscillibacter sp.]|nr:hypothetical protein [Oscillibacter sp.]